MTEHLCFFDFETQSKCDLPTEGLGRYLVDPTTKAYAFTFRLPGMSCADLWDIRFKAPSQIVRHIEAGGWFVAHNAPFDYNIWNEVLRQQWPELPAMRGPARRWGCRSRRTPTDPA